MSTTTTIFENSEAIASGQKVAGKGFFDRLIQARMRRGKETVRFQMSRMSEDRLAGLGFTAEQIAYIRTNGDIPKSFWR